MNRRTSKAITKKAKLILVEWMKTLIPEEDSNKINTSNILSYTPEQEYYLKKRTRCLNSYHIKWVRKHIKRLLPTFKLEDITLKVFEENRYRG